MIERDRRCVNIRHVKQSLSVDVFIRLIVIRKPSDLFRVLAK